MPISVAPSRKYLTLVTPDAVPGLVPASTADAVSGTRADCLMDVPLLGLVTDTVGAAASIRTRVLLTGSAVAQLSADDWYFTVDVDDTANGPAYAVPLVAGSLPSVV